MDHISEWGFNSYLQFAAGSGAGESEDVKLCCTTVEAVSSWERGESVLYRHTGRRRDLAAGEEPAAATQSDATDATENANVRTYSTRCTQRCARSQCEEEFWAEELKSFYFNKTLIHSILAGLNL